MLGLFRKFYVEADHRNSTMFVEHKLEIFSIIGQQSTIILMADLIGDFLLIGIGASQLFTRRSRKLDDGCALRLANLCIWG